MNKPLAAFKQHAQGEQWREATIADASDGANTRSGEEYWPDDRLDLREIIGVFRRRSRVILGVAALVLAIVGVHTFTAIPRYSATAQVLLDLRKKNVVEMESVLSGLPADTNMVNTEVEVLKSPALAARVFETLNLQNDPEFNPGLKESADFGGLTALFRRGGNAQDNSLPAPAGGRTGAPNADSRAQSAYDNLALAFMRKMTVRRVGLTYVVEISFSSQSPQKAALIANAFAEEYIESQIAAKLDANVRANEWLAQRLTQLRDDLRAADQQAARYRAEKGLTDAKGVTLNEQQLAELNAQLIQARADLAGKQARLERVSMLVRSGGDVGTVAEVVQSATISNLRDQQAQVVRRRAELSSKYGPRHPEIVKVDSEVDDMEAQIHNEVDRIVASLENEMRIARERVRSMESSLQALEAASSQDNQDFVELRQLEREAEAARVLYETFLSRFKETSEASLFEDADARIVARASAPTIPSWPNKKRNMILALALAGALGAGVAYVIEFFDNGLRTNGEIERATGLPVLASVPMIMQRRGRKRRRGLGKIKIQDLDADKPLFPFTESWRSLATAIALFDVDSAPRTILITSALPGEGKTTASLYYGREIARAGKSVVVVDCDLRRASLTVALLRMKKFKAQVQSKLSAGLVELLAGECSVNDALIQNADATLSFIPLAKRPSNPSSMLMSEAFIKLLATLRERFDYVILDSAPVLPIADSRMLAGKVDVVIFALRWEHTPKQAVLEALRELKSAKARIAGVLLTQVDMRKQRRYGYADSGYYYGKCGKYGKYGKYEKGYA